ncbi:MAG: hypothetical protein IPK50_09105 [Fibrobacterota bacterium]|nr:hypothetical protein [Fibrobacterota bacterium]QQS07035.1 MAG: hypothetical protein IPK50_09105 [Fibrobacterota bacterium]
MCLCVLAARGLAECPAALFARGVELAEKGRTADALGVFRAVTEKDSTCLEGWNNRAALEAASGDLFGSQRSLSKALTVRRDVQSVAVNLEKLRSRMARLAYDSAFGTPSKLPALQLELQKDLGKNRRTKPSEDSDSLSRVLSMAQQEIRELTRVRDSLLSTGRVAMIESADAQAKAVEHPEPVRTSPPVEVKPLPPAPVAPVAPPPSAPKETESPESAALRAVQAWAAAWSAQNVDAYLGFYDPQFDVPDKISRKAWEDRRRERILAPKAIHVEVVSPLAKRTGPGTVEVVYKQVYQTEDVRLVLRKRIVLTKKGKEWKIVSEREAR